MSIVNFGKAYLCTFAVVYGPNWLGVFCVPRNSISVDGFRCAALGVGFGEAVAGVFTMGQMQRMGCR